MSYRPGTQWAPLTEPEGPPGPPPTQEAHPGRRLVGARFPPRTERNFLKTKLSAGEGAASRPSRCRPRAEAGSPVRNTAG